LERAVTDEANVNGLAFHLYFLGFGVDFRYNMWYTENGWSVLKNVNKE